MNHLLRWRISHSLRTFQAAADRSGVPTQRRPSVVSNALILCNLRPLATAFMNNPGLTGLCAPVVKEKRVSRSLPE